MSQQKRAVMEQHPSQVLHVRGDSDQDLEALFSVLSNQNDAVGPVSKPPHFLPLNKRNLPKSFFEQPARPSHSRDGSQDSTNYNVHNQQITGAPVHPASHPGLAINHNRAVSCPAQLPLSLSAVPPQPPPQHTKQSSVDFADEGMAQLHLPKSSWDPLKASGQQRYFINQDQQLWPKSVSTNALNTNNNAPGGHTPQGTLSPQSHPSSPSVSLQNIGPLPRGWEQGVTPDGEIYYINHLDRTTSWFDPRLPKHMQRPGPVKLAPNGQPSPLHTNHPTQLPPPSHPTQQPSPCPQPQPTLAQQISPGQQQQAQQQQPPQPQPQQQQPQQQPPPLSQMLSQQQQATTMSNPQGVRQPTVSQPGAPNPQYNIQVELERLKAEKDRLQREQEDIAKRELLLQDILSKPKPTPQNDSQPNPAPPPTSIQSVSTSGVDPFLGQANNNLESHARQNSGDSGLGGMTNYSLPRTPEDFLSNVDEMDIQENVQKLNLKPDFNMNDLQGNVCMDTGPLGDHEQAGMESEDLVSSLQEEISSFSNDLLNDVDVGKMENLLWL